MQLTDQRAKEILSGLTNAGHRDGLTFIVGEEAGVAVCYVRCATHDLLEGPEDDNTYWDSRRHGIAWPTPEKAIDAIAGAYVRMDHRLGQKEEWHAKPLRFADDGALVEEIVQPGWQPGLYRSPLPFAPLSIVQNNGTRLVGTQGAWGLRINVGGRGWKEGASPMSIEKCALLESNNYSSLRH